MPQIRVMPKKRVVFYLNAKEAIKAEKKKGDHANLHRWAAAVIKKALK